MIKPVYMYTIRWIKKKLKVGGGKNKGALDEMRRAIWKKSHVAGFEPAMVAPASFIGNEPELDHVRLKCHKTRHEAILFVVADLAEMLPPVTVVLARRYRRRFKSLYGCSFKWLKYNRPKRLE